MTWIVSEKKGFAEMIRDRQSEHVREVGGVDHINTHVTYKSHLNHLKQAAFHRELQGLNHVSTSNHVVITILQHLIPRNIHG